MQNSIALSTRRRTDLASLLRCLWRPDLEQLEDRTAPAAWQPIGPAPLWSHLDHDRIESPFSGRISALAVSPNYDQQNHAALFVGAAGGGIWRSTDFATSDKPSFMPLTDFVSALNGAPVNGAITVGSIAVDPLAPWRIYVGTGEANYTSGSRSGAGILVSENGGNTWSMLSTGPDDAFVGAHISRILVHPGFSNILFASTYRSIGSGEGAIYKSENWGETWERTGLSPNNNRLLVSDLDFTYSTNDHRFTLFAGVIRDCFKTSVELGE